MIRSIRNVFRLLRIAVTLARHDALFVLEQTEAAPGVVFAAKIMRRRKVNGRPGERLARALQEAGPSFIKLGQALATRSDLLGEEVAADLSHLQDHLPPFDFAEVRKSIEGDFGQPLEALYSSFDEKPIAAASIAQVHFAVTSDGREVAVKVLRPGIEAAFNRDLDLFFWTAAVLEAARPEFRRFRPAESVRTLAESVALEMDLRFEAAASAELARNFEGDTTFHVPKIDWARTGKRVLTTERVTGIRIDRRSEIVAAGHNPDEVLQKAALAFFKQVFRDGFFHADLHPGNMFVRSDGSIAVIDFGIMGRLDRKTRRHLGELLNAFLNRDYRRAAEIHFEAGWVPSTQSVDWFTQACCSIAEPILDLPQNEISIARLLGQLFQVSKTFHMEVQTNLLLLQKTMLVAEGTGRRLNPDVNMWTLARPLVEEWVGELFGPRARLREGVEETALALGKLPKIISRLELVTDALATSGIRMHPDTARILRAPSRRSGLVVLIWVLVAAAASAGLTLLLVSG